MMGNSSDEKPGSSVISFREAAALAEKHGTPLLVCDLRRIESNYKRLKSLLRRFDLYYAVKANPHPLILKTLVKLGSCFDVASKNEIQMCFDAGAKPEQILYANPVKPREHLKFAYDNGVTSFTFDNPHEVEKMAKYAPGSSVILRLMVSDVGSACQFSAKFGAKESDAMGLLKKAKDLGLKPDGLSFHVGSQCTNPDNFSNALDMCSSIFKNAEKKGIEMSVLDTGGGIPIEYLEKIYPLEELAEVINGKITELFPPNVKPIAEPGRPIVGDAMTLVARVTGVAKRQNKDCIYIDDGVYHSLSEKVFGHCEYKFVSEKQGPLKKHTVFGPTCDSMDMVSDKAMLPEMKEDDLLLCLSAGAYTNAAATHFNGFEPAKIVFL